MASVKTLSLSNFDAWPIIEGGKGIGASNGISAGHFAKNGCVGTVSATNADYYDVNGNIVHQYYDPSWTRLERFEKLVKYAIEGAVAQVKIAHDVSGGNGPIHMNVLWEAGGTEHILIEVLKRTKGMLHGIVAGAGLPYKLGEIASAFGVYYYPIVSSDKAFSVLWRRSFNKFPNHLGGVVYEDPWRAGGHNGISNVDDPKKPQDPMPKLAALRASMNKFSLEETPIIFAGGVWKLSDYPNLINNPEIGKIAFQFGTRPLVTVESPISQQWKEILLNVKKNDVKLHKFSPTGFYSSALNNSFLKELQSQFDRQVLISRKPDDEFTAKIPISPDTERYFFVKEEDAQRAHDYISMGYDNLIRTPDGTAMFVSTERSKQIREDQVACMGCLSQCRFSGWATNKEHTTGVMPDARSFCIQKTLQDIGHDGDVNTNLAFAGHNAYRFAEDPFYHRDGKVYIPTMKELLEALKMGN